ncbi:MAG: winged helix-turn-helix domain-containing protein [Rudaea sp.]
MDQRCQTYRFDDIEIDAHSHRVTRAGNEMNEGPLIYLFDQIRVEPEAHRVFRAGCPIELEPKAFALLLQFIEHPQELLDRNRLLDAVWGHQHVAPATLNRIIALLRRALGDDVANPRYIQTVHGLGYRFAVTPTHAQGSLDAGASIAAAVAMPAVRNVAAEGAGSPQPEVSKSIANPPRSIDATAKYRLVIGSLLLVLIAAIVFAALQARDPHRPAAVSVTKPPGIAVLPFSARDADTDLRATAEGLSDSLTDAFARSANLRVAGRESVLALGRGQANPQRVAEVLDVDYVLSGEIEPTKGSVRSHIVLWHRGETAPIWVDEQESPREQLFRIVVPLIERVRTSLIAAPVSAPVVLAVPISSQDLYWLGRHYWYQRTPESLARALGYFQRVAAENPQFAQAYCGMADTYMLLYEYADLSLDEASAKARAAVARAKELAPDLADAYASEGLILLDEAHPELAVTALEHALKLAPQHPEASIWYGTALAYSGRPRDALAWHRSVEQLDPLSPVLQTYLGIDLLLAGEQDQAAEKFVRAIELNPDYAEPHWQLALREQFYGHIASSVTTLLAAQHLRGANGYAGFNLAYSYLLLGDGRRALGSLRDAPDISPIERLAPQLWALWLTNQPALAGTIVDEIKPGAVTAAVHKALRARMLLLRGDDAAARRTYDSLFAAAPEQGDPFLRLWLADLGLGHFADWIALLPETSPLRATALRAYAEQIDRLQQAGVRLPALHYQHAQIAALQGDAEQAATQLDQAQAAGWLDASAFDRDRVWRKYAQAPWLAEARKRQSERVATERAALAEQK